MSYYPRYEIVERSQNSPEFIYMNNTITTDYMDNANDLENGFQHNDHHNDNNYYHFDGQQNFQQNDQFNPQQNVYHTIDENVSQNNPQNFQYNINPYPQNNNINYDLNQNMDYNYYDNTQDNIHGDNQYNFQHNIQNEIYNNIQYDIQSDLPHDVFQTENNDTLLYNNNQISENEIEQNKEHSISQKNENPIDVSFLLEEKIVDEFSVISIKSPEREDIDNIEDDYISEIPLEDENQNQYSYNNLEIPSIEIIQIANNNQGLFPVDYIINDSDSTTDEYFTLESEFDNEGLYYEVEIESEHELIDEEIPIPQNAQIVVNYNNCVNDSIIRYETVERRVDDYVDEIYNVAYSYDQFCYDSTPVTESYMPNFVDNMPQYNNMDQSRNNIIQTRDMHNLSEYNRVSQPVTQYSQNQRVMVNATDMRNLYKNDKQSFQVENNITEQSVIVNNSNSYNQIIQDKIQSDANIIGHNYDMKQNFKSRKRQQSIIAKNCPNKESSSSESEQTNKKLKIEIKISHCPNSLRDGISIKNNVSSSGSEYTDYFCRWKHCDFFCSSVEILYKHVCSTHTTENDYIYCQWGSCFTDDDKDTPSRIPVCISMADYLTHMYSHTHTKQFFCRKEGCKSDGFYTKSDLEKHVRECYHLKQINICRESLCLTTFTTGKARLAHENKFHFKTETYVYHCPVFKCNKAFPDNSSLHRHIRLSHGNKAYELVQHLKHKSSSEKQTNKVLGLLTNRVANHLNDELINQQTIGENGSKNLLKFYDCLDVCVHKEYNSIKNLLVKMIFDIKDNKIKAPINAFINRYINKHKSNNGVIIIEEVFINQLSRMIFKNLKISDYPLIPSSVHEENQEREAELKITKKFLFNKLEDDEKIQQTKRYFLKRTDEIDYTFQKMPDQLNEEDKYVEEFIFIEQELLNFGKPINGINFDFPKITSISSSKNPIVRRNHEKIRNGTNSPTLRNHETNEFCPAYLMRVLKDYKKYLNSNRGKNFLEYKNKLPLHIRIPEEYIDETKKKKTTDKSKSKNKGNVNLNTTSRKEKKESTVMIMDDSDVEYMVE